MLSKTGAYVKSYDDQTNWINFLIEDDDFLENILFFGIKSLLMLKGNLTANCSIIKVYSKPK